MTLKRKLKKAIGIPSFISGAILLAVGYAGGYKTTQYITPPSTVQVSEGSIQVRFSPKGGCEQMLIKAINQARHTLHIAIFDITSENVMNAIIKKHQSGTKVYIVADRRQSKGKHSKIIILHQHGIPIRIAKCSGVMHHKFTIIDRGASGMLTGSFNYSFGAENKNKENLLWIRSTKLSQVYLKEWEKLWEKGKPCSF